MLTQDEMKIAEYEGFGVVEGRVYAIEQDITEALAAYTASIKANSVADALAGVIHNGKVIWNKDIRQMPNGTSLIVVSPASPKVKG